MAARRGCQFCAAFSASRAALRSAFATYLLAGLIVTFLEGVLFFGLTLAGQLLRGLVVAAGFDAQPLTSALVALHSGAIAESMVDSSGAGAKAARWAAERLLEDAARSSHATG